MNINPVDSYFLLSLIASVQENEKHIIPLGCYATLEEAVFALEMWKYTNQKPIDNF